MSSQYSFRVPTSVFTSAVRPSQAFIALTVITTPSALCGVGQAAAQEEATLHTNDVIVTTTVEPADDATMDLGGEELPSSPTNVDSEEPSGLSEDENLGFEVASIEDLESSDVESSDDEDNEAVNNEAESSDTDTSLEESPAAKAPIDVEDGPAPVFDAQVNIPTPDATESAVEAPVPADDLGFVAESIEAIDAPAFTEADTDATGYADESQSDAARIPSAPVVTAKTSPKPLPAQAQTPSTVAPAQEVTAPVNKESEAKPGQNRAHIHIEHEGDVLPVRTADIDLRHHPELTEVAVDADLASSASIEDQLVIEHRGLDVLATQTAELWQSIPGTAAIDAAVTGAANELVRGTPLAAGGEGRIDLGRTRIEYGIESPVWGLPHYQSTSAVAPKNQP